MESLMQDLRYSYRVLVKNPGFTAISILTLALGMGACTAIFSIVDAVLLRPLAFPESSRIVQVREVSEKGGRMALAEPNFLDLRARSRTLEAAAQYSGGLTTVTGGREPVRARTLLVSGDFFKVMGVQPMTGRLFTPEESRPGGPAVVVVSYAFWQQVLGGRADLDHTVLKIGDHGCSVVGVMPPSFSFPQQTEIWIPRGLYPPQASRSAHNWSVVARLSPLASLEQARSEVSGIARQLKQENGSDMDGVDFALIPLQEYMVGSVRNVLMIILAAVALLLVVACANVANLLLAQATARHKEFSVRAALGASRSRLARQFITENLSLALCAGVLGAVISRWGVDMLIALNRRGLPRADEVAVDLRALAFTSALSVIIAVTLGLVPVARFSSGDLQTGLKESGRGQSANSASSRLRGVLVVSQMALTLVLLIGAGLLGKSFYHLLQTDPGFRTESALIMDLSLPRYDDPQRQRQFLAAYKQLLEKGSTTEPTPPPIADERHKRQVLFYQQLLERVSQIPGVIVAGSVNTLPMSGGGSNGTFFSENNPSNTGNAEYRQASAGYFEALDIPLLRGRLFEENDKPDTPPVAVISQSLAQRYWPNEDPLGKSVQFGNMDGDLRPLSIVGVVGDVRDRGLDSSVVPTIYANAQQRPLSSSMAIVVRAKGDSAALTSALRQTVQSLNPDLPTNFRTVEQVFSSSLDARRFSLVIFGVFATVALILAVMGIYGVMSYAVTQRTNEIGIRIALGARARDVIRLVVGQGLTMALIGIGVGLAAAFGLTRLMSSLLYGVGATDPVTFAAIPIFLAAVALLASYIPARRATKVDPLIALRYE